MKNKIAAAFILCAALFAFNSCKQAASSLALYVPKDASAVFVIDSKSVMDKIASSGITIDSLADMMSERNGDGLKWKDIENSGVDVSKPFYVFTKETNSIQQGHVKSGALIAEVNDEGKLETFLKARKPGATVSTATGYKYIELHDNIIAGWSSKVLIVAGVSGNNDSDSLLQSQLTTLFNQKTSESIASTDAFKEPFSKPGDIHFYTNTAGRLNEVGMPGISKLSELVEGSYTAGAINFENGRIDASAETHYNKTLGGIINKYPAQEVKTEMIKNYPDTLTGFGIVSFNPKLLVDVLHYLGFDAMADGFTSNIGFTTADVVNAFSGDVAVMFSSHPQNTMENSIKNGGFLLAAAVGDKAAFNKVMAGLLDKKILTKNGDTYQLGLSGGHGFVMETGGNNLFIASSDELIKTYQVPGKKQPLPAEVEKDLNNKSMMVYFDINQFLRNKPIKDSAAVEIHNNSNYHSYKIAENAKGTFKNFVAFADKGDGKTIASTYRLNFVNESENSLASLVKFIIAAHEEGKERSGAIFPPSSHLINPDSLAKSQDSAGGQ